MVVRILVVLLGLMFIVPGVMQARAWRMSNGEPRHVRAAVGGLAASRLLAGLAFLVAGVFVLWPVILVGAICVLVGNAGASYARRQLKRHTED
jgi:hypothetical protein